MNLKKSVLSCLGAVLLLGNFPYANAFGEPTGDFTSLIRTTITAGKPIRLSYSISCISRQYLNLFLFENHNWLSIPEEIRNHIVYHIGFDFQGLALSIAEIGDDGIELSDYTPSFSRIFKEIDAMYILNKIVKHIPFSYA